jgi:hypothetical protein
MYHLSQYFKIKIQFGYDINKTKKFNQSQLESENSSQVKCILNTQLNYSYLIQTPEAKA